MWQSGHNAVSEAVMVAIDVGLVEPYASQGVAAFVGRHGHAASIVSYIAVRGTRAPRDPCPMVSPHRRVERGHEASGWLPDLDFPWPAHVLVRLAVTDEDKLVIIQILRDVDHSQRQGSDRYSD